MSALFPGEPKKLDVLTHLEEVRKRILFCFIILGCCSVLSFFNGDNILRYLKEPLRGTVDRLIFIGPTEAFVAYVKVSLLSGFIISFPFIILQIWLFLAPAIDRTVKRRVIFWLSIAILLFFLGVVFSRYVALPAALKFLIDFGRRIALPSISLGKYVSFSGAIILVGGIIFELPVFMAILSETRIVEQSMLKKKRMHAYLAILIFSAIITPTQDILNMLIFAIPMIVLYEAGIMIVGAIEKQRA